MRRFALAVAAGLAIAGSVSAQAPQQPSEAIEAARKYRLEFPPQLRETATAENRERRVWLAGANECALPNGATRGVNQVATYLGWRYRCVSVLNSEMQSTGVAWTRLPEAEQEPFGR